MSIDDYLAPMGGNSALMFCFCFLEEREQDGCTVISTTASQQEGPEFNSITRPSCVELHALSVSAWVFSRYSGFLPQSEDI